MTPFKALYGRDSPTILRWGSIASKIDKVGILFQQHNRILTELKDHLNCIGEHMKRQADLKMREVQFDIGDKVFLKLQTYRFKKLARRSNEKLNP